MATLLSTKQRKLPRGAQVNSLARIGTRATAKADHIQSLIDGGSDLFGDDDRAEVLKLRDKASRAAEELVQLVRDNPDYAYWTRPQRRVAGI